MKRYRERAIKEDLKKKMVFIVGPRQVGKTWLAKKIAEEYQNPLYLNYDNLKHREIIKNELWLDKTDLIVFDEIHKMKNWKNYLKGVYDTKKQNLNILITGSARLETFHQSGDSMAGRFYIHHLMPFSLRELFSVSKNLDPVKAENDLIELGGFPEPYLSNDLRESKRWRKLYVNGLIREDILNFENIRNIKTINLLFEVLRQRIGSPISYSSLARDLDTSVNTVKKYLDILESLYILFRVYPYSKNIARSILKEPKIYFYDTGLVKSDEGIKFENHIAVSLLKDCYYQNDILGENLKLHYIRTKDKKEIDFALVNEDKIENLIEVKNKKTKIPSNLRYFTDKYNLKGTLLLKEANSEYKEGNIEVVKSVNFFKDKMNI